MGNRHISSDLKDIAIHLFNSGWTIHDVSEALSISVPSIYRWQLNIEQFGTVNPPSAIRGRVRVVTRAVLTAMDNLYQDESDLYLDEVLIWLSFHHNIYISQSTLQRTLMEAGLTRKVLQKIASERNEDLRQQFRDAINDPNLFAGDGSEFVVLDETSKNERTWARTHGRSLSGERAQLEDVFVRGDRFSLLAALTIEGYMAVRVVEGSFDAHEFLDFVQEEVVRI